MQNWFTYPLKLGEFHYHIFHSLEVQFTAFYDMTGMVQNQSIISTGVMALAKFLILAFGILFAVHYIPQQVHIIVGIYIFQLIILVISTKRIVKKN